MKIGILKIAIATIFSFLIFAGHALAEDSIKVLETQSMLGEAKVRCEQIGMTMVDSGTLYKHRKDLRLTGHAFADNHGTIVLVSLKTGEDSIPRLHTKGLVICKTQAAPEPIAGSRKHPFVAESGKQPLKLLPGSLDLMAGTTLCEKEGQGWEVASLKTLTSRYKELQADGDAFSSVGAEGAMRTVNLKTGAVGIKNIAEQAKIVCIQGSGKQDMSDVAMVNQETKDMPILSHEEIERQDAAEREKMKVYRQNDTVRRALAIWGPCGTTLLLRTVTSCGVDERAYKKLGDAEFKESKSEMDKCGKAASNECIRASEAVNQAKAAECDKAVDQLVADDLSRSEFKGDPQRLVSTIQDPATPPFGPSIRFCDPSKTAH